jgi:predicted Fe-Mo cluster-binding NifX family protein
MPQTRQPLRDMKIAVASQNRKTVTGHAGKCRKFWIYTVEGGAVKGRELLELPIEQSFHESARGAPHPLDGVQVLIAGGMGAGMRGRLEEKGILAVATAETDLERAVAAWLAGSLVELPPEANDHDHDHHGHGHGHGKPVSITTLSADALISQPPKH